MKFYISILFVCLFSIKSRGINTLASGYQLPASGKVSVQGHGTCRTFTNANSTKTFFIPTATSNEYTSFVNNLPANVTAATCKSCNEIYTYNGAANGTGLYTIDPDGAGANAAFQAYCDMTNDGGGWTLLLTSAAAGWTSTTVLSLNASTPSLTSNYSILNQGDYIKTISGGNFQYRIEANASRRWGGVWTAPQSYSFTSTSNGKTSITINTQYDNWTYNDSGIEARMPFVCGAGEAAALTTSYYCSSSWWGTLAASSTGYNPAPWDASYMPNPQKIWYWVR
ncbi:MAG: hypothetical protein RJB66_1540 [Pseudomonadota bacterium]